MTHVYIRLILELALIYAAFCCPLKYESVGRQPLGMIEGKIFASSDWREDKPRDRSIELQDAENVMAKSTAIQEDRELAAGIHLQVTFSAYLSKNVDGLEVGEIVVFDRVLVNDAKMYDIKTGIFTIPVSGVYSFTYYIGSRGNSQEFVILTLAGKQMSEAAVQTNSDADDGQGGNTSIFHATKGQEVAVRHKEGSGKLEGSEIYRITTFSGTLLYVR